MPLLSCPKHETLFELVSIPGEISVWKRAGLKAHVVSCRPCRERTETIRQSWQSYFSPEPDVTSSLMRVYSRLQKDETLILKGWKLSETPPVPRGASHWLLKEGWLFRGGLSLGALALVSAIVISQMETERPAKRMAAMQEPRAPLAQIRVEDRNTVKVHYVQPELLHSIEFETTSAR